MKRSLSTLIFATLTLSVSCLISSAHAKGEAASQETYLRLQTGFQSGSLNDETDFSAALEIDLGLGLLFEDFALEVNGGLSFSAQDYQRSDIIEVSSYIGARAEGLLYYRARTGSASVLVGGGFGWRRLSQNATYSYQEGELIQITSSTQRELLEVTTSVLVRLAVLFESRWIISADYDTFSLAKGDLHIKTLGVNVGYVY